MARPKNPPKPSAFDTLRKFQENANPDHLYTIEEIAVYVGKSPQLLRVYYMNKQLPEPKHSIKHVKRTTRMFTIREAQQIKNYFANISVGSMFKARRFKERQQNAKNASEQS